MDEVLTSHRIEDAISYYIRPRILLFNGITVMRTINFKHNNGSLSYIDVLLRMTCIKAVCFLLSIYVVYVHVLSKLYKSIDM